jgi:hypothetical protein
MCIVIASLDGRDVNRAAFLGRANKSNVRKSASEVKLHDEPIVVALDVEDNAIALHKTRGCEVSFNVARRLPIRVLSNGKPCPKRLSDIRVFVSEVAKRAPSDDSRSRVLACSHFGIK